MADITLTVDCEARDVLRAHLNYSLAPFEEIDGSIYGYDEARGRVLKARAMLVFSLLDDLGWEQHGHLERYPITLAPIESAWLSECKSSAQEVLDSAGLSPRPRRCRRLRLVRRWSLARSVCRGREEGHHQSRIGRRGPLPCARRSRHDGGGVMPPTLILHHGGGRAEYVEHPTEVARKALLAAAEVETEPVAAAMRRVAAALPIRRHTRERSSDAPTAVVHVAAVPGGEVEQHQRDRIGNPRRVARRTKNVVVGRSLGRAGVWRRLWK